jgi:soluble lytic murein transglycosylase-like protein
MRRRRRHRAAIKGIVMGAMVFGTGAKPKALEKQKDELSTPEVRVSIDSLVAVPAYLAYDDIIDEAAKLHGVDADLIHAVIQTESGFNAMAVSPAGAQGLMQLMPELQEELGVTDPFSPRQNIMAGTEYLKRLLTRHHGDVALTLASYNAGPGNVSKYKGVPPFKETRAYVRKIKDLLAETNGD